MSFLRTLQLPSLVKWLLLVMQVLVYIFVQYTMYFWMKLQVSNFIFLEKKREKCILTAVQVNSFQRTWDIFCLCLVMCLLLYKMYMQTSLNKLFFVQLKIQGSNKVLSCYPGQVDFSSGQIKTCAGQSLFEKYMYMYMY